MADLDDKQASATIKITGANTSGDESNYAKVSANQDLGVVNSIDSGLSVNGTITVGTSAVEAKVGGSTLANRKLLIVNNASNVTIYWGFSSAVTTADGIPINKDQEATWSIGSVQKVYLIAGAAGNTIKIAEGS